MCQILFKWLQKPILGMVHINPFSGLRYNKEKIKDFGLVITPPYDVIDENAREGFLKSSEYNMVRLLLEKDYDKAADLFDEWQKKKILVGDGEECLYIYGQTFFCNGGRHTRTGFISLVKLEQLGKGILPHEKILDGPYQDRLRLIRATRANFGCVFLLYKDKEKVIENYMSNKVIDLKPDIRFNDKLGVEHFLWKISDKDFIAKIKDEMLNHQCVIADGHHRYRSALEFMKEKPEIKDACYATACFVNSFNEGLFVLPIDRFVFNLKDVNINEMLKRFEKNFVIEEFSDAKELIQELEQYNKDKVKRKHVFGMYCFLNKVFYLLKLKDEKELSRHNMGKTDAYKKLDVSILHKLIFEDIFGISEDDQFKGIFIEYAKGNKRDLKKLEGDYQLAFFINPPSIEEIFLIANASETMPQKSTYFYPKIYSGLVINKIEV